MLVDLYGIFDSEELGQEFLGHCEKQRVIC